MSSTSRIDTDEMKEIPDPKQMKLDSSVALCEGSLNTNPSGQEMMGRKVAKDEEKIGKKEMIYAAEDQMIMKLEEGTLTKESIRSIFKEMQKHLLNQEKIRLMIEMKEIMKMAEATSAVAEAASEAFRDAGGFEAAFEAFRDAFRD